MVSFAFFAASREIREVLTLYLRVRKPELASRCDQQLQRICQPPEVANFEVQVRAGAVAVSYTHLDVYKRQSLASASRSSRRAMPRTASRSGVCVSSAV